MLLAASLCCQTVCVCMWECSEKVINTHLPMVHVVIAIILQTVYSSLLLHLVVSVWTGAVNGLFSLGNPTAASWACNLVAFIIYLKPIILNKQPKCNKLSTCVYITEQIWNILLVDWTFLCTLVNKCMSENQKGQQNHNYSFSCCNFIKTHISM